MREAAVKAAIEEIARRELHIQGELTGGDLSELLDSIQRLTLVVAIEDHFEVVLEPEEEATITTIDDVARLVAGKLS